MRYISILLLLTTSYVYADEKLNNALENANLAIPYFGSNMYGERKAKIYKISPKTNWLIHQARYGGDGQHTSNILMIFELFNHRSKRIMERSPSINKLFQYSLSNVKFDFNGEYLVKIHGEIIETLCEVCDGWEVSSPGDIFKIPVSITVPSLIIRPTLSKQESEKLLNNLKKSSDAKIKEQLGYGRKKYPSYANRVVKRINELLTLYNK